MGLLSRSLAWLWRSIRRTPLRVLLYFLVLYALTLLVMYLAEVLFLRKLRTHPRYINVVADPSGNVLSIHHPERDHAQGQQHKVPEYSADKQLHAVLVVDTYVTFSYGHTLNFPICIHDPSIDIYISGSLSSGVLYEYDHVQVLMEHFSRGSGEGLLDLGANIGVFSLPAVYLGHPVVAVDALPENVLRLRASVLLGYSNVDKRINVIHAAVSNQRSNLYARKSTNNVGGTTMVNKDNCGINCDKNYPIPAILMDDLIDQIPFKRGILKIDIEGHEEKAFEQSHKLMAAVDFHTIFMEWRFYRKLYRVHSSSERIEKFINFFTSRDYVACEVVSGRKLALYDWGNWPYEIIWKKTRAHSTL